MANISTNSGNVPYIKTGYKKLLGLGEGVTGEEFLMEFENNSNIKFLVQSAQIPAVQRDNIESRGPLGVQFNQQGAYKNAQDITITIKEVVKGVAYAFIRDWVVNHRYLTVKLTLTGEKFSANASTSWILEDCWIECEAAELSVEDSTTLVRPSITLHANWVGHEDTSTVDLTVN